MAIRVSQDMFQPLGTILCQPVLRFLVLFIEGWCLGRVSIFLTWQQSLNLISFGEFWHKRKYVKQKRNLRHKKICSMLILRGVVVSPNFFRVFSFTSHTKIHQKRFNDCFQDRFTKTLFDNLKRRFKRETIKTEFLKFCLYISS